MRFTNTTYKGQSTAFEQRMTFKILMMRRMMRLVIKVMIGMRTMRKNRMAMEVDEEGDGKDEDGEDDGKAHADRMRRTRTRKVRVKRRVMRMKMRLPRPVARGSTAAG